MASYYSGTLTILGPHQDVKYSVLNNNCNGNIGVKVQKLNCCSTKIVIDTRSIEAQGSLNWGDCYTGLRYCLHTIHYNYMTVHVLSLDTFCIIDDSFERNNVYCP